jgi:hypothetical protein
MFIAASPAQQPAQRTGAAFVGVTGAPLVGRYDGAHVLDVLAATGPGGLAAAPAGGGVAHEG